MSYVNHALRRATVQSLREYLLYGIEEPNTHSSKSYEVRLQIAFKQLYEVVKKYDEKGEESALFTIINRVLTEYEHVYMEVGFKQDFGWRMRLIEVKYPKKLMKSIRICIVLYTKM